VRLRCRGSTGEAIVYALGLHLQQPHLFQNADRFVAVSDAQARRLLDLGLPGGVTDTLHNFVPGGNPVNASRAAEGEYALASGRLVEEKGFDVAIAAAREARVPLVVAGDGPERDRLRELAVGADVRFTGRLKPTALAELRRRAAVVLVPSRSEEAFPYAGLDALADGVPLLASDLGGLPELVGGQGLLAAGDTRAWAGRLGQLWRSPELRQELGAAGLERVRARFSDDLYYERLLGIYARAGTSAPSGN
jgi:glycosyltransferase involved in cell wall biosynthesis